MTKRRAILALLLIVLIATPAAAQERGLRIDEIDTHRHPEISMIVTAPTRVAGIDVGDLFTLSENEVDRPLEVRALRFEPLEVVLAVDTSGSMVGEPLEAAKTAAALFVERMPPTTLVSVLGFGSNSSRVADFSADTGALVTAVQTLAAGGETALYDAVIDAAESFEEDHDARRFVVLLSDGGDTVSRASLEEARDALVDAGVNVFAVALATDESDSAALASLVGSAGSVVSVADAAALSEVYDVIASELINRYEIVYESAAWGETEVLLRLRHESVIAVASTTVELPPPPPVPTTTVPPPPITVAPRPEPTPAVPFLVEETGFGDTWVPVVGLVAIFLALMIILVPALTFDRRSKPLAGIARPAAADTRSAIAMRAESVADWILRRRGGESRLNQTLDNAGVSLRPGEFIVLGASGAVAAGGFGLALSGPLFALILMIVALFVPRMVLTVRTDRRRTAFADQLDGTLQLIAGNLRAGYGLTQAANSVAQEAEAPTSEEFERVVVETRLGRGLTDALDSMAERVGSDDFRWVVQAITIQREVGGDLAELLDTVSSTIRERQQLRRQVKALSAEGRISAYVLIALPFAMAGLLMGTNPDYISLLVDKPLGRVLSVLAVILMIIGIMWIRRIIRLVL